MPTENDKKSEMVVRSRLEGLGSLAIIAGAFMCFIEAGPLNLIGVGLLPGGMTMFAIGNAARWIIATQVEIHSE